MRAKKLPSGNWRAQAFKIIDGEKIRKSFTASTRTEAELLAVAWVARTQEKIDLPTVGEILDAYISHREAILSPSTIRGYILLADKIKARIGRVVASDMTSEKVQAYINELALDHSPKTVKNYANLLIPALNSVMPDIKFNVKFPQKTPPTYSIPESETITELINRAKGDLKLAILLGAIGGLRRGEICALKYEDVMRDFNAVYVHADMVRDKENKWIYKNIPKTSASIRRVELPKEIIDLIPDGEPTAYIVPRTPNYITDRFCELRNSLGLNCRFHDLRHYSASLCHAIGIPDQYIQERHGWRTDQTLKAVYRNTLTEKANTFTKKANKEFAKIISDVI